MFAGVAAVVPRRKGPLELAALTAALLLAFELSLTHWFYLYLPWVLPFVLLALFLPRERGRTRPVDVRGGGRVPRDALLAAAAFVLRR